MNELEAALRSDFRISRIAWNEILYTYYLSNYGRYVECLPGMKYNVTEVRPEGLPQEGWESMTHEADAEFIKEVGRRK